MPLIASNTLQFQLVGNLALATCCKKQDLTVTSGIMVSKGNDSQMAQHVRLRMVEEILEVSLTKLQSG